MFLGCLIAEERRGKKEEGTIFVDPPVCFLPSFFYDHYAKCVGRCRSRRRPFACAHPSPVIKFLLPRHKHIYVCSLFTAPLDTYGSFLLPSISPLFHGKYTEKIKFMSGSGRRRRLQPAGAPPRTHSRWWTRVLFVYRVALAEAASSSREVCDRINNLMDGEALAHHTAHTTRWLLHCSRAATCVIDVFCLMRNRGWFVGNAVRQQGGHAQWIIVTVGEEGVGMFVIRLL